MGKSTTLKTPPPPDPRLTIAAQQQANSEAARLSGTLGAVDITSPFGNVTFDRREYGPLAGTPTAQDIQLPQAVVDAINSQNALRLGLSERAGGILEGVPQGGFQVPEGLPQIASSTGSLPPVAGLDFSGLPSVSSGLQFSGPAAPNAVTADGLPMPQFAMQGADMPGAVQGFGGPESLGFEGRDLPNMPQFNINGPAAPTGIDTGGLAGLPMDFAGERARLEQASFDRVSNLLEPQFQQQQERLDQQLANRGVPLTGEDATQLRDNLNRNQNQAREQAALAAVGMGASEEARLFGQSLAARGQQFGERADQFGAGMSARGMALDEAQIAAGFGGQNFDRSLAARGQEFSEAQQQALFGMQARGQAFGEDVTGFETGLAARNQALQEAGQQAQFGLNLRGQQFGEQLGAFQTGMSARDMAFQEALSGFQSDMAARQQLGTEGQQVFQSQMAEQNAALQQALSNAQLAQTARQTGINEGLLERTQSMNEIAAILAGSPAIQTPSLPPIPQVGVQPADALGAFSLQQQGQQFNANLAAQQQMSTMSNLAGLGGSLGSAFLLSSRDFKTANATVDHVRVLNTVADLDVEAWTYKPEAGQGSGRHVGPYAEDFNAAFGLDNKQIIDMVDAFGVALSAIKGLKQQVDELTAEIKELKNGH